MRKQLRKRHVIFSGLRELRPELPYPPFDVDLVFLQNVQHARATESFRGRPNQNERVAAP